MTTSYFVKTNVQSGYFSMNDGEFAANRFPRESVDRLFNLHAINRDLFLSHMKDLEIIRHTLQNTIDH